VRRLAARLTCGPLLVLAGVVPIAAAPDDAVVIEPRIRLHAISAREILEGRAHAAIAGGTWRPGASVVDTTGFNTIVTRRLDRVWQTRLPRDVDLAAIQISCEIDGTDGRHDRLSHGSSPDSSVRATARALPPIVVGVDEETITVEGGVVLELDLSAVHAAGQYSGTMTVTLHQF